MKNKSTRPSITKKSKKPKTRADRNSPEATAEEQSKPYDELNNPDLEIPKKRETPEQDLNKNQTHLLPLDGS